MKIVPLLLLSLLGALGATNVAAKECSPAKKARVLEPATQKHKVAFLDCDLTLLEGETITKQVRIRGAKSSGVRLICRGGRIGLPGKRSLLYRKDIIQISSVRGKDNRWSRPEDVIIDGCTVNGAIRVSGLGPHGQAKFVKASSRNGNHTEYAQSVAPRGIVLRNLVIRGDGRIPVYFSPGVTNSRLVNSRIIGNSVSSGIYLDAESAHNVISGNVFEVRTAREILSIDGSAHNVVKNNKFYHADLGGVFIYRNCGEGGTARHQKPRYNSVTGNTFYYDGGRNARPGVWLSFKSIQRVLFLCPQDAGIPYGSGTDDRNFARQNTVSQNTFVGASGDTVLDWGENNKVFENRRVAR
ncbi:right-handed parallel beta-helix repeat-containing protein [Pseudoruegeria sp. HB172150]|uniref:right-handed parallel beta-helix repeat-containing protein n=1 Tax=Pseudoruegeria sp. HB172150 TaxID=2721164 RepID=UPI001C132361|nr:right-handed parallel beta-helix repeat-containing protein [Pseudoruegeria sp. HB172150]